MFLKLCGNKVPKEKPGDDNKGIIRVGKAFQASVPDLMINSKDNAYSGEDKLLWDPSVISQDVTEQYLESMDCKDASDEERALWLLHQCSYNTKEAILRSRCSIQHIADFDTWSDFERDCLFKGLQKHGKNFHTIQKSIRSKSVEETVSFYYYWKAKKKISRRINGHSLTQKS